MAKMIFIFFIIKIWLMTKWYAVKSISAFPHSSVEQSCCRAVGCSLCESILWEITVAF